jgi:hypothetical protein
MEAAGRAILEVAGFVIAAGGLYDLFTPRLPANLDAMCAGSAPARRVARELLRALGAALTAIGIAVALLVFGRGPELSRAELFLVLLLVLPAEGGNAVAMRRVGSPWQIPVAFALFALCGAVMAAM